MKFLSIPFNSLYAYIQWFNVVLAVTIIKYLDGSDNAI
jgi:hypothetical protein